MKALFDLMFNVYQPDQVDEAITRSGHYSYKWNDEYNPAQWQAVGTLTNDQALGVINRFSRSVNAKYMVEADLDDVLMEHVGNQTQAADRLGMNRGSLRKMLKRKDPSSVLVINGETYSKWECHNKRGMYPRGKKA